MYKKIQLKNFSDGRGDLIPIEFGKDYQNADIPFNVQRCYFISVAERDDSSVRGQHAHKDLEQVIIAANGSFTLDLDDGMGNRVSLKMNKKDEGIHIKNLIWRELKNFSDDCLVLVLASNHYQQDDYIHSYDDFMEIVAAQKEQPQHIKAAQ